MKKKNICMSNIKLIPVQCRYHNTQHNANISRQAGSKADIKKSCTSCHFFFFLEKGTHNTPNRKSEEWKNDKICLSFFFFFVFFPFCISFIVKEINQITSETSSTWTMKSQVCALSHCCYWYIVWFWKKKKTHREQTLHECNIVPFIIFLLLVTTVVESLLGPLFIFYSPWISSQSFTEWKRAFIFAFLKFYYCMTARLISEKINVLFDSIRTFFLSMWHGYETHELNCVGKVSEKLRIKKIRFFFVVLNFL